MVLLPALKSACSSAMTLVSLEGVDDEALPNILNAFFIRFEAHEFYSEIARCETVTDP